MLALALLTFYLERAVREEEPHAPLRRHDPDYLVSNFTTTTYNRDGCRRGDDVGGADGTLPRRRLDRAAGSAHGAD